ncbi:MAG: helix-turn-helix transcriptional regulator [Eubacterium sp.]|nr:helix-turn-helix transcriptional regulator [Eubacterium sp.]
MGKKSIKEDKNIYFQSREEAGLTRAQASEIMGFISESRIEKIESEKTTVQPEDVVAMAEAYKKPSLCNYYCSHECRIGEAYVPEIKLSSLAEISLGILSSINSLNQQKDRLIEIASDGKINEDEVTDFLLIQSRLEKLSLSIDSLKLWLENAIANGQLDSATIQKLQDNN